MNRNQLKKLIRESLREEALSEDISGDQVIMMGLAAKFILPFVIGAIRGAKDTARDVVEAGIDDYKAAKSGTGQRVRAAQQDLRRAEHYLKKLPNPEKKDYWLWKVASARNELKKAIHVDKYQGFDKYMPWVKQPEYEEVPPKPETPNSIKKKQHAAKLKRRRELARQKREKEKAAKAGTMTENIIREETAK